MPADRVRAVVDTNVLLSGLLWRGRPHLPVERIRVGAIGLVSSPELIAELGGVILRPKFKSMLAQSGIDVDRMLAEVRLLAEVVVPPRLSIPGSRDPNDDAVLALAVAARPDLIVTGDADLLVLRSYAGVSIVTPAEALARGDE